MLCLLVWLPDLLVNTCPRLLVLAHLLGQRQTWQSMCTQPVAICSALIYRSYAMFYPLFWLPDLLVSPCPRLLVLAHVPRQRWWRSMCTHMAVIYSDHVIGSRRLSYILYLTDPGTLAWQLLYTHLVYIQSVELYLRPEETEFPSHGGDLQMPKQQWETDKDSKKSLQKFCNTLSLCQAIHSLADTQKTCIAPRQIQDTAYL